MAFENWIGSVSANPIFVSGCAWRYESHGTPFFFVTKAAGMWPLKEVFVTNVEVFVTTVLSARCMAFRFDTKQLVSSGFVTKDEFP